MSNPDQPGEEQEAVWRADAGEEEEERSEAGQDRPTEAEPHGEDPHHLLGADPGAAQRAEDVEFIPEICGQGGEYRRADDVLERTMLRELEAEDNRPDAETDGSSMLPEYYTVEPNRRADCRDYDGV